MKSIMLRPLAKALIILMLFAVIAGMVKVNAAEPADFDPADQDAALQDGFTCTLNPWSLEQSIAVGVMSESSTDLTDKEKALSTGNTVLSYYLQTAKGKGPLWLKTTDIQLSLIQDDSPVYSLETIQPLGGVNRNGSLWFWQGRYANQGFGWRKLSADKTGIFGLNAFYDYGFQLPSKTCS